MDNPGSPKPAESAPVAENRRLDSWKEIACYLNRHVSTVQRWKNEEGLPVHGHVHNKQATVYAYQAEIDEWSSSRDGERLIKAAASDAPATSEEYDPEFETVIIPGPQGVIDRFINWLLCYRRQLLIAAIPVLMIVFAVLLYRAMADLIQPSLFPLPGVRLVALPLD